MLTRLTYTGVGSRETPLSYRPVMQEIARIAETYGYVLESGGAPAADTWFEEGVVDPANKEIYLPWQGFNGNLSPLFHVSEEAINIARRYHPAFHRLDRSGRLLMGRNSHQVLGRELNNPTNFLVCWTQGGLLKGGTAQAIRIANAYHIPVYNLFNEDAYRLVIEHIERSSLW